MKMGDSLGRSRKRRRKPARDETPVADEGSTAEGSTAEGSTDENSGAESPDQQESKRAAPAARTPERAARGPLKGISRRVMLGMVAGVIGIGWLGGYNLATRLFFPSAPPPGDLFEVPNLRGLGFASASERLAGSGLALGAIDSLQHPSVAAGLILGQSPLPGQVGQPETAVRVTVSMGPQTRSVPDVRRLDESRARIVLESSGFVVTIDTAEAEEPRGRVIEMDPPPDSVVALPSAIELLVSTGPPVVPMPLVLGLELAEAESLLDSLGLVVSGVEEVFRFGRDQGIVVEQEPAADTALQRGSAVLLKVGRQGRSEEQ